MRTRFLASLLFLSGAGALALEVSWFRRTAQVAGATSVAMAGVLAAVIGGMAVGAHVFGKIADKSRDPLRLYGLLEVGVAIGAVLSPTLLSVARPAFDAFGIPLRFVLATIILAPPAVLMGGTLPAAAAALRATRSRGRDVGVLYAVNTLGAVCGTFSAGFLLLPALGLSWTMRLAALLPAAAGILALRTKGEPAPAPGAPPHPAPEERRAILLYAASGFLGLVAEVAFTRQLVLVFGSATYAFTTMLGVFLLGIGAGGMIGARLARRESGHMAMLETTVAITAAVFSLSALGVYALPRLYLEATLKLGTGFGVGLAVRLALSTLVLLPGALGLGAAFPLAAQLATKGAMGGGTGRLYAANTLASILGSTLAVFLLVPALGPQHATGAAALLAALVVAVRRRWLRDLVATTPVVTFRRLAKDFRELLKQPRRAKLGHGQRLALLAAVAALGLLPAPEIARERLLSGVYFSPWAWTTGGRIDEKSWKEGVDIAFFEYGREATISVWRWYGTNSVLIDGKAEATNQVLADDVHLSLLGHAPMACHPDPQRVLVVGLGLGTTYHAVEAHDPALLRVVELEPAIVDAAARLGTRPKDIVLDDARSYLRATDETFDVITSDPIHPWVRGSGDLYTKEYLESCRDRLAPGGVACLWVPLYQMGVSDIKEVLRTFCDVFPSVALYYGGQDLVAVGAEQLGEPRRLVGKPLEQLLALGAGDLERLEVARRDRILFAVGEGPILTDDALRLEYSTPKQVDYHEREKCLAWVRELWQAPAPPYGTMLEAEAAEARGDYEELMRLLAEARKEAPGNQYVQRRLGEIHVFAADQAVREGKLEDALYHFRAARPYVPGDPRLIGIEADLRAAQGLPDVAAELLGKLLEENPKSAYLKRRIAALQRKE